MLFYGLISLALLLLMGGLSYLFPSYALKLFSIASAKFWELLKPRFLKTFKPKDFTPEQFDRIRRGENPFHDKGKK